MAAAALFFDRLNRLVAIFNFTFTSPVRISSGKCFRSVTSDIGFLLVGETRSDTMSLCGIPSPVSSSTIWRSLSAGV